MSKNPSFFKEKYKSGQKALNENEYGRIIEACDNYQDRLLIMIAVDLGLRREDIVKLEVKNIDFKNGWLSYLEKKKGNKIHRVPIGPKLKQELQMYLDSTKLTGYLFPPRQKSDSPHMSGRTAYNRLLYLCNKIKIEKRPFHSLRATCIKLKQRKGWPVEKVSALINDTVGTVQAHYSTPTDEELKKAMEEMEGI